MGNKTPAAVVYYETQGLKETIKAEWKAKKNLKWNGLRILHKMMPNNFTKNLRNPFFSNCSEVAPSCTTEPSSKQEIDIQ